MMIYEIESALKQSEMTAVELQKLTGFSRSAVNKYLMLLVKDGAAHVTHVRREAGTAGRPSPVYAAGYEVKGSIKSLAEVMQQWGSNAVQ